MADRTSQPSTLIGPNPIYGGVTLLWNAAVPGFDSASGATPTGGIKGTGDTDGAGQHYRIFGADGAMQFTGPFPSGAYTAVIVHRMPTPSVTQATLVSTTPGGGFSYSPYTSGGGQYHPMSHQGAGGGDSNPTPVGNAFNEVAWVEVVCFTGAGGSPANQLRRRRKLNDGTLESTTETLAFNNPVDAAIYLGSLANVTTQGLSDLLIRPGDVGSTEQDALVSNPYRIYAGDSVDGSAPGVTLTAAASLVAGGASASDAATGATLTATASLIAGSASSGTNAAAAGVTLAAAASLLAGLAAGNNNATLNFQAAGMELGARTGAAISSFQLDAGVNYRYTVHADGLVLGAALITSGVVATDSAGKLPNATNALLFSGVAYRVIGIRQSDGESFSTRMVAVA